MRNAGGKRRSIASGASAPAPTRDAASRGGSLVAARPGRRGVRAAMSLSRLWQQQGKRAKAHALLAPIYAWFTEGFDTADLQEAKTLLEEFA